MKYKELSERQKLIIDNMILSLFILKSHEEQNLTSCIIEDIRDIFNDEFEITDKDIEDIVLD